MRTRVHCNFIFFMMLLSILPLRAEGNLVLAGGGSEGEIGETESWSYLLYQKFFFQGDITGDGILQVGILALEFPDDPESAGWLPAYFEWIGKTLGLKVIAQNWAIPSRERANDPNFLRPLQTADILFIKGGDQGEYYDFWNETLLEKILQSVAQKGVVGGTSAGAMSLSSFSFSGGNDLVSLDVLANACTSYLDDVSEAKTSGIHTDFLNFLPNALVDTHYTQRGRMGRMIGILAKATTDSGNHKILAIGIEQKTGIWIHQGIAEVIGFGEVSWIQETEKTRCVRKLGSPLIYTDLRLDRLTHGKKYDFSHRMPLLPENLKIGKEELSHSFSGIVSSEVLSERINFEFNATIAPEDFKLIRDGTKPYLANSIGFKDFENSEKRMEEQESLFYALQKIPEGIGFLLCSGSELSQRDSEHLGIEPTDPNQRPSAGMILDMKTVLFQENGAFLSNYSVSNGSLRATTAIYVTLHVFGNSNQQGFFLNLKNREVLFIRE
ncbi:MAG: cyanophycinase [Planctomycetota bacterium]